MSSEILFEDDDYKVINKSPGIVVKEKLNGLFPAHRLDKDTSGVLVLAKSEDVLKKIQAEFKARRVKKVYIALIYGMPKDKEGVIDQPLKRSPRYPMRRTVHPDGKAAVTGWRVEEEFGEQKYSLMRLFPKTGRTHQLRAHLHWLGHPIVGDKLYNFSKQKKLEGVSRQMLHADKLEILGKSFEAKMPEDFLNVIDELRGN